MAYNITLPLDAPWETERDVLQDESGFEITHLEASLPNDKAKRDDALVDIYVGEMPEGETAEDQAFANYAEVVGFDDDDPEDFNPISKFTFNNRPAYGFEAVCEDESPMRFLAQEVRKGVLAVIVIVCDTRQRIDEVHRLFECKLRIKTENQ